MTIKNKLARLCELQDEPLSEQEIASNVFFKQSVPQEGPVSLVLVDLCEIAREEDEWLRLVLQNKERNFDLYYPALLMGSCIFFFFVDSLVHVVSHRKEYVLAEKPLCVTTNNKNLNNVIKRFNDLEKYRGASHFVDQCLNFLHLKQEGQIESLIRSFLLIPALNYLGHQQYFSSDEQLQHFFQQMPAQHKKQYQPQIDAIQKRFDLINNRQRPVQIESPVLNDRVLCLNAIGFDALFLIGMLLDLEKRTNKKVYELFDYIVASSTAVGVAHAAATGQFELIYTHMEELAKSMRVDLKKKQKQQKSVLTSEQYDASRKCLERTLHGDMHCKVLIVVNEDKLRCVPFSVESALQVMLPRHADTHTRNTDASTLVGDIALAFGLKAHSLSVSKQTRLSEDHLHLRFDTENVDDPYKSASDVAMETREWTEFCDSLCVCDLSDSEMDMFESEPTIKTIRNWKVWGTKSHLGEEIAVQMLWSRSSLTLINKTSSEVYTYKVDAMRKYGVIQRSVRGSQIICLLLGAFSLGA